MADITKDREEDRKLAVDFGPALDSGDSVSSVSSVEVSQAASGGGWEDVSAEFGSPTGTPNGDKVNVTLGAASSGEQAEGSNYVLRVTVLTANGETLIETPSIQVTADGDTDAP